MASGTGIVLPTVYFPASASPPIAAASTASAAAIYTDGTFTYLSTGGGAYLPIVTGAGGLVTLDGAYQGGNQINLTQAKGAVILSSARTSGNILQITTTNAPGTVTAPVTGIAIDLSSLGTAATPSTFDLPAITVNGAYSSVAKSTSRGLVYIVSGYRNATALRIAARSKQATAGSIDAVGWDATNYEGAAAASILTGQTHVVTIDGVTNVDAATNNVEFLNLRCLVPTTNTTNGCGVLVQRGSDPVSFAQTLVRVIDDVGTASSALQGININLAPSAATIQATGLVVTVSGLLSTISGAASFNYGALAGTTRGTVRIFGPVSGTTTGAHTDLKIDHSGASLTLGAALTGINVDLSSNITAGAQTVTGVTVSIPASTSASTRGFVVNTAQTTGTSFGALFFTTNTTVSAGGMHGLYMDMQTNMLTSANSVNAITILMPINTAGANTGAIRILSQQRAGALCFSGSFNGATSLSGTLYGTFVDLATNLTAGAQTVYGAYISMPASSSASTAGVYVTTAQTAGTGVQVAFSGSLSATVVGYGLDLYNLTHNNNNLVGLYMTIGTTTAASAQTVGGIVIDDWSTKQYTFQMLLRKKEGSIVHAEYQTSTTLSAGVTALDFDFSTNVTPSANKLVGLNLSFAAGAASSSRFITLATSTTTHHQMEFASPTDGTYFHILGPAAGQLRIGAGIPATGGAGREIAIVASDAGATSGGAGGSIYLNEGAGNGGGARGQIAIGQNANMRLGFFAGGPATQQTPTGSRGGNAALASLLTALAAYGLIVDGTSA